MKKKVMILSLAFLICCGTSHAADKNRIRASFDQGWTFRLCKSHADATEVIRQLGVANAIMRSSLIIMLLAQSRHHSLVRTSLIRQLLSRMRW